MKIEIKKSAERNWQWRSRRGKNITAWATGYDTKAGAVTAAGNECIAMIKLGYGALTKEQKTLARQRVRAAVVVVDA